MELLDNHNHNGKATVNNSNTAPKSKPKRHLPSLPSAVSAAEMSNVSFGALVDKTAVEWSALKNYEAFSLSADGSFPMIKVSRSKAVRLADREVMLVGSGRCHRISLNATPRNENNLP